ncbi:hypothetical protein CsatB_023597 [Cannabis sativa]
MKYSYYLWLFTTIIALLVVGIRSNPPDGVCGKQHNYYVCDTDYCCSKDGFCGTTEPYCGDGHCQSQCPTPSPDDVSDIITSSLFDKMLSFRNISGCESNGFYTYDAFINAARYFSGFGTTGSLETRKRELAAFFGQISHETGGGCYIREQDDQSDHCIDSPKWPCVPGQFYYGRGPIQVRYNDNYGQVGYALDNLDLLGNPELVATDALVSFQTAIWFWMTTSVHLNKPSPHDVIVGEWKPTEIDEAANRFPGYGVITNILNGGSECGHGEDAMVKNRIANYKRCCDFLGVSTGDNLDCYNQRPFNDDPQTSYGVLKMSVDE